MSMSRSISSIRLARQAVLIAALISSPLWSQAPCGNCVQDGDINIIDAFISAQVAAGMAVLTPSEFARCNVRGPWGDASAPGATLDILDALWIAQYVVGLRPELRCVLGSPVWDLRQEASSIPDNEVGLSWSLDLDQDGCADWLEMEAIMLGGAVAVWRSQCDGSAVMTDAFNTGLWQATFLTTGDLDLDGNDDFVIVGTNPQPYPPPHYGLITYFNDGQGNFTEGQRFVVPNGPDRVWIAEMDGDGFRDLVVQQSDGFGFAFIDVYFGIAHGEYASPVTFQIGNPTEGYRQIFQVLDLDRDGFADLVGMSHDYGSYTNSHIIFRWNDGSGLSFQEQILPQQPPGAPATHLIRDVRPVDLDGDGVLDILCEWALDMSTFDMDIFSVSGFGSRLFSTLLEHIASGVGNSPLRNSRGIADFDGDGYLDVGLHLLNGNIEFHSYTPAGWVGPVLVLPIGTTSADGLALDLDGDGDMDWMANTAPPTRPTRIWMNHRW